MGKKGKEDVVRSKDGTLCFAIEYSSCDVFNAMTSQDGGLHETEERRRRKEKVVERGKPLLDIADIGIDAFKRSYRFVRVWRNLCLVTGRRTM